MGWVNCAKGGYGKHFARRKHNDVQQNYVMSMVESAKVEIVQIPSAEMNADFMIKPLESGDV